MRNLIILMFLFFSQTSWANDALWTELEAAYEFRSAHAKEEIPHTGRKMLLDFEAMKQSLTATSKGINTETIITLPSPDGQFFSFRAENVSVMSPALAVRYPDIQTWKIVNTGNPEITGRIDIGPRGFHGLFHTSDGDRIFIDPEHQEGAPQTEIYTVLSSHDNHGTADSDFNCELHDEPTESPIAQRVLETASDDVRTYRLALAVTGEYTQLFGGTKALALAGMTTTVNRINQVFERDLNIKLELIANNDDIIYTSPSSDPFTNQDAASMVHENLTNTNIVIGKGNYDIGHVFGTGNTGGLAFISSACGANKAGGVTGSNSPEGEAFNIDYVAHEIGHQVGATHTFNGYQQNCSANNRIQSTAVEPGSGSTIMAYAGICGGDNLQSNSDSFFHSVSIDQVKEFTNHGQGSSCGTLTASLNNKPEADAGKDYIIPANTPFVLSGYSNDIDSDPLLNSWEQIDTGASSDLYSDLIDNPLFRTWKPTTKTKRYFPRLKELLNNTSILGELLPSTNRELNFNLLVRDNKGGIASDTVKLNVVATDSTFGITSNSIPQKLVAGQSFQLHWNVAATNQSPINCSAVDIGFISVTERYSPVLTNAPNDGSQLVTLPNNMESVTDANIQISCSNNIFFAVSKTKHNVSGVKPSLSLKRPSLLKSGSGVNTLAYTLQLSSPAIETTTIYYQANSTELAKKAIRGEVVIPVGSTTTSINIPVIEETLTTAVRAANLVVETPDGLTIEKEEIEEIFQEVELITLPEASPESVEATVALNTASNQVGGGAMEPLFVLAILLLTRFRYFYGRNYTQIESTLSEILEKQVIL